MKAHIYINKHKIDTTFLKVNNEAMGAVEEVFTPLESCLISTTKK